MIPASKRLSVPEPEPPLTVTVPARLPRSWAAGLRLTVSLPSPRLTVTGTPAVLSAMLTAGVPVTVTLGDGSDTVNQVDGHRNAGRAVFDVNGVVARRGCD